MILVQYLPLTPNYFSDVIKLANIVHGDNYMDKHSLEKMHLQGIKHDINSSFVAVDNNQVLGFRISFAAGQWDIDRWCTPKHWPVLPSQMAYFKCIAVDDKTQGQGIGPKLLHASIVALRQQGALAGVAHLWKQSPGNGAIKYFTKAGGELIKVHHNRWSELCDTQGYECTVCRNGCDCQAAEMALLF